MFTYRQVHTLNVQKCTRRYAGYTNIFLAKSKKAVEEILILRS